MKKLNSILSIISLCITSFLLVLLVFAWYATNKVANVNDGVGSVADLDDIVDTVEYYNFKNASGTTYTVRQYVKQVYGANGDKTQLRYFNNENEGGGALTPPTDPMLGYDGKFQMNEFDYLKQGFSKYLIKITLKTGKSLSKVQFLSTAGYFIGYDSNGGNGSVTTVSSLSMSSVIKFGYLTNNVSIAANHSTVTFTDNVSYQHFEYTNAGNEYTGAISVSKKDVVSSLSPANAQSQVTFYLLIDYNLEALNAFYGNNLSNSDSWVGSPQFNVLDFKIFILG